MSFADLGQDLVHTIATMLPFVPLRPVATVNLAAVDRRLRATLRPWTRDLTERVAQSAHFLEHIGRTSRQFRTCEVLDLKRLHLTDDHVRVLAANVSLLANVRVMTLATNDITFSGLLVLLDALAPSAEHPHGCMPKLYYLDVSNNARERVRRCHLVMLKCPASGKITTLSHDHVVTDAVLAAYRSCFGDVLQ